MSLGDVSPITSTHDIADCALVDTVGCRNGFLPFAARSAPSDLWNIGGRKFLHSHSLANSMPEPSLRAHIIHVVLMSSSEEMERVEAFPVIAAMENVKAWWDGPENFLVDDAMSKARRAASKPNHRISIGMDHGISFEAGFQIRSDGLSSLCDNIKSSVIFTNLTHDSFYHQEAA